jgi:queuine tRNA-ribosyltransferase
LTWGGRVNVLQARHREDQSPLDHRCACPVCKRYSRAYIRHLFHSKEMLGPRLVTQHNLTFYADLTRAARVAIAAGRYPEFAREAETRMTEEDEIGSN